MNLRRGWLRAGAAATLSLLLLGGCGKREMPASTAASAPGVAAVGEFSVLAGSELRDIEPLLQKAAQAAGVPLRLSYAGALDIVERVNAGERFDAILPASGAYPALALATKPLSREKLFYSRVALGVKAAKLKQLGWDTKAPTWGDIAQAAGAGKLHYAMTNPTSSNTGMSALFAVASGESVRMAQTIKPDGRVLFFNPRNSASITASPERPNSSSSSGAMRNSASTQPSRRASSAASNATRSHAASEAIAATVRLKPVR